MPTPVTAGRSPELRAHALELLRGPHAHLSFEEALEDFPVALQGTRTAGSPHTAWEILEHLRIAQWDFLEFCRDPEHESPEFPSGYWPETSLPPAGAWDGSVRAFLEDRRAFETWVQKPDTDLLAPVPDEDGPTLLHEIALLAAHNSYHLGQIVQIRRALGA
jgi:hypothetical protein